MRPIRTVAAVAAPFESLGTLLSSHRAITRVSLAALSFTLVIVFSQQAPTQAGPEQAPLVPESLLPQNIGMAVATDARLTIPFDESMDPASVESAIQLLPEQRVELSWNDDHTALSLSPERLWRADERYLVVIGESSATADGAALRAAHRYSFTTELAPAVTDFQVRLATADLPVSAAVANRETPSVRSLPLDISAAADTDAVADAASQPPTRTAIEVSADTSISIRFSDDMDTADVEEHFAITPEVPGDLSWSEGDLIFTPSERLVAGERYTISVIGAHDQVGNSLGGKGNFSFVVQAGAQLTRTEPALGARDVEPAIVEMWFSAPMDVEATNEAFALTDTSTGELVGGRLNWNEDNTQLVYSPDRPFAGERSFQVALGAGASDADGNPIVASWKFTTKPGAAIAAQGARSDASTRTAAPSIGAPAPSSTLVGYALNQINAARAAYGFAPLWLDGAMTAVATAHAWDQVSRGYYSHTSLSGQSLYQRLAAGGVGFSAASENQCHYYGQGAEGTLNWCHSAFMAEPYPGQWNHIANILNPKWTRVGVGIGDNGSHVVITWDFAN